MPLTTTTPAVLKRNIIDAIEAIDPEHTRFQSSWKYVRSIDMVAGPEVRNFHVELLNTRVPEQGCFQEYEAELVIWASYGSIGPDYDDTITAHDGIQLWRSLCAANIDGVRVFMETPDFAPETEEEGFLWGSFSMPVRYLHTDPTLGI